MYSTKARHSQLRLSVCMIKIFIRGGGGVVDGKGVAVKDACSGVMGDFSHILQRTGGG